MPYFHYLQKDITFGHPSRWLYLCKFAGPAKGVAMPAKPAGTHFIIAY
jgi:hypothetical protein